MGLFVCQLMVAVCVTVKLVTYFVYYIIYSLFKSDTPKIENKKKMTTFTSLLLLLKVYHIEL